MHMRVKAAYTSHMTVVRHGFLTNSRTHLSLLCTSVCETYVVQFLFQINLKYFSLLDCQIQEESVGQESQTSLLKSMTNCLLDHPSFTAGHAVFGVHSMWRAVVRVHSTWRPAGERVSCFTALHTFIAL